MAGLTLTVPEGFNRQALIILNVPSPYTINFGGGGTGGWFGISVDGVTLPMFASYSYNGSMLTNNPGRVPTTLVVAVMLGLKPQKIVALASNCIVDSPASLSAIM
ncbi:MAG TPA: hypothetical protein VGF13_20355 [Verrucomicrobiae bacterium]|jgi:hypothetical protein